MNYSSEEETVNCRKLPECARSLYEACGIGYFTQADLARKGNLSVRTVQRHFPKQEDLRNAVAKPIKPNLLYQTLAHQIGALPIQ